MASITNICNQALLLLGEKVITDITEGTVVADTCEAFYQTSKETVLREHDWNCAMSRATFSLDATSPVYEWDFQHVLPTECLRVVEIDSLDHDEYQVEGRRLLSNLSGIKARFIANILEGSMDPMLVKTVAAYLASELAYPITESNTKSDQMMKLYALRARDAGGANKIEGVTRRTSPGRLISSRSGRPGVNPR